MFIKAIGNNLINIDAITMLSLRKQESTGSAEIVAIVRDSSCAKAVWQGSIDDADTMFRRIQTFMLVNNVHVFSLLD